MTNGDKIRRMNDEELAYAIQPGWQSCPTQMLGSRNCKQDCTECVLDWLREEVQEDG